jgi:superfamily II DNA or RNA helicase
MASKHSQAPVLISQGVFDSVKTFRDFEQRVSALFDTNTKAQGDAFEIFVEAYLATQPILQCQETWLVGDIPVEIREALNLPNDSKGIDGVYKSMLDDYVPYQVKFRSNRPALGFNEVAAFLGITEKAADRLLITNCDTIAIDVQNRTGIRSLRGVDFDQLTDEDFTVIENWLKKKQKKRQPLTPDPYQVEALTNISTHLEANDRGTVVMACGTGKTLVALWAVEQSKANSILVLVPSLTLLQQTLEEWSVHNSWGKDFTYLCVCSDPSVNLKNDEIEIDPTDIPFRIDTDPAIVRSYLASVNGKQKIVFSTYQSGQVISQATKGEFKFDIGVFDEAHKTTGSVNGRFALALNDKNIQIKKRLFLTATPKHFKIKKKSQAETFNADDFVLASMDNDVIYGGRAHTLTFGQAASKGIICPYKVVISLIDKQEVDDFSLKNGITLVEGDSVKAKWVASQIAVSRAIKHTNAKKIITFHSRVKTAREFASDDVYGIKKFIDDFSVFHVHGKQKSNERKDTISKFRKAPRSLITNAKCLTEGVDVPAVDMVVFVDPRHSKIDIAQAVGRAMRKPRGGDKKVGYIVIPIFAENTNDESIEKSIQTENYEDIAIILNALLEIDNELIDIVQKYKEEIGGDKLINKNDFKEKFEVIGPLIDLDELTDFISINVLDQLGGTWNEWFGRLIKFKEDNGHCNVPQLYITKTGHKLGWWVTTQRRQRLKLILSENRISQLNNIGFLWVGTKGGPESNLWEHNLQLYLNFKKREGHVNIPKGHKEDGLDLDQWIKNQRRGHFNQLSGTGKYKLNNERFQKLNDTGFEWDPLEKIWEEYFNALLSFKKRELNVKVKYNHIENGLNLGSWLNTQKYQKNKGKLSIERIQKFEEIGVRWSIVKKINKNKISIEFEKKFNLLLKFKEREGHCAVPYAHIEMGTKLGHWVNNQRSLKSNLGMEVINKLDQIGFVWTVKKKDS